MHDRARLVADLRALGLAAGDTVMVHASVRAVGEIAGGPDEIHLAIKQVVKSWRGDIPGNLICYKGQVVSQGIEFLETIYQILAHGRAARGWQTPQTGCPA